jgi:hypothetical protein
VTLAVITRDKEKKTMGFSEEVHGTKPKWAKLKILDPLELQQQLLSGEVENWDWIQQLGDLWQNYMMGGIENLIPNFSDILKEGGATTESMLSKAGEFLTGEIPKDVQGQVMRSAAFQNLMSGGGPSFLQSLQARDLGQTSLDMIQKGANLATMGGNAAQRWQQMAQSTMMNPSSQMYSPQWYAQFRQEQELAKTANKQLRYNIAASPDPQWKARAELLAQYGGMALGGGMGGGGGGWSAGQSYGGQGANLGFGGNYQSAMYGTEPTGFGGAAGSAMSPWKSGSTDMYFPTQQSWNAYQGAPPMGYGGSGGWGYETPYQYNIAPNPWGG